MDVAVEGVRPGHGWSRERDDGPFIDTAGVIDHAAPVRARVALHRLRDQRLELADEIGGRSDLRRRVPFEGESVGEVLMKHLTAEPDLNRVPAQFRPIVARRWRLVTYHP